jgi:hypothetical protein
MQHLRAAGAGLRVVGAAAEGENEPPLTTAPGEPAKSMYVRVAPTAAR